jgi:hypothetical protein
VDSTACQIGLSQLRMRSINIKSIEQEVSIKQSAKRDQLLINYCYCNVNFILSSTVFKIYPKTGKILIRNLGGHDIGQ